MEVISRRKESPPGPVAEAAKARTVRLGVGVGVEVGVGVGGGGVVVFWCKRRRVGGDNAHG